MRASFDLKWTISSRALLPMAEPSGRRETPAIPCSRKYSVAAPSSWSFRFFIRAGLRFADALETVAPLAEDTIREIEEPTEGGSRSCPSRDCSHRRKLDCRANQCSHWRAETATHYRADTEIWVADNVQTVWGPCR